MNLHQLNVEARAGHVEELNLIAIEGGDYLLEARIQAMPTHWQMVVANGCGCIRWRMRGNCSTLCRCCR